MADTASRTSAAGRKPHIPTKRSREQVQLRAAIGWSQEQIAADLDMNRTTFLKHYKADFKLGKLRKRGEAVDLLWGSARGGNVSAQKAMIALMVEAKGEAGKLPLKPKQPENVEPVAPPPARSLKLGKKVQRQIEAENAGVGTDWGADLLPGDAKPN